MEIIIEFALNVVEFNPNFRYIQRIKPEVPQST